MGERMGSLLEKNIEKVFRIAGFKVSRGVFINNYEIDVLAESEDYQIVVQCKQYERSKLNIRDLIHLWDSKNKKIDADKILIVIYGQVISFEDKQLAAEMDIECWGEQEMDRADEIINGDNPKEELLKFLGLTISSGKSESYEPVPRNIPWQLIITLILVFAMLSEPLLALSIGALSLIIWFFRYLFKQKK